ncbi:MAG: hypothetical protein DHS20C21_22440 [Gemmatimonadota bacterium]|nr:MAG: hypothetical protein DHS20C21_22440 [Gemmatimonadota bacterium]
MSEYELRVAAGDDLAAIRGLLRGAGLPVPGADEAVRFVVAVRAGNVVAVAGWEVHDAHALLRSVTVRESERGGGVGARVVADALRAIEAEGVRQAYLVTMDAADFFGRFGFRTIAREDVALPIRSSREYQIHECVGGQWMERRR